MHCLFIVFKIYPGAESGDVTELLKYYSSPILKNCLPHQNHQTNQTSNDRAMDFYAREKQNTEVTMDSEESTHINLGGTPTTLRHAGKSPVKLPPIGELIHIADHLNRNPEPEVDASFSASTSEDDRMNNVGSIWLRKDQIGDELSAEKYLDWAAKHTTKNLAAMDGVTPNTICLRICNAAKIIAERDGRTKDEVVSGLDLKRLQNKVISYNEHQLVSQQRSNGRGCMRRKWKKERLTEAQNVITKDGPPAFLSSDDMLELAANHTDKELTDILDIVLGTVSNRIKKAATAVANRNGTSPEEVIGRLDQNRLQNGVIDQKVYEATSKRRARGRAAAKFVGTRAKRTLAVELTGHEVAERSEQ